MIIDTYGQFCDAVSVNTGGAATYNLGDIIDLGADAEDIGNGQVVYAVITIDTACLSSSGTLAFQIVSDATTTISTSTQTIHAQTEISLQAALTQGVQFVMPLPLHNPTYERYLAFQQVTATAAFTAGAVNAFLTLDPIGWKSYPDGDN